MSKKLPMPELSQASERLALMAGVVRQERRSLERVSERALAQEREDQAGLREALREARRDPSSRVLSELIESREWVNAHLKMLGLPAPVRWFASGGELYGQLDTQLLRMAPGQNGGRRQLVRLTGAGEIPVSSLRELLVAEPVSVQGVREVPPALLALASGSLNTVLNLGAIFGGIAVILASPMAGLAVVLLSPPLRAMTLLLMLLSIAGCYGGQFIMHRLSNPEVRAAWLVRYARARGVQLE